MTTFLSYASSLGCKNEDALALIRQHCSKESSIRREGEYHDHDDADLLPTPQRLRQAFPADAESHIRIQDFLHCLCVLCKPQHGALEDDDRERLLPHEILSNDKTLKAFATLILSGCLFALREYVKSEDDLKTFTKFIGNPGRALRRRLFRLVGTDDALCPHTEETRPATTLLSQQCVTCLASTFRECVGRKFRLQTIKTLRKSDKIEDYVLSRTNLPIVLEHEDQIDKPSRPGVRFSRCKIEATHCLSEELTQHELFRKRYRLLPSDGHHDHEPTPSDLETVTLEEKEASIALALGSLDHANIAKVILVFREDADDPHLSLLFKREQHNLEEYLQEFTSANLLGGFVSRVWEHTILLDHGLWRNLLGIVDAVATIHEVAEGGKQPRRLGPPIFGHFDIKPANILVSDGGTLLLTDFGQAASRTVGTSDYAPPEHELSNRVELVPSYDVWSMACVLLQALVFIRSAAEGGEQEGKNAVHTFYSQRLHETENNQAGAFWIKNHHGPGSSLRKAVDNELTQLATRRHPKTKVVVNQLRQMLSVNPVRRPTIRECLKVFGSSGLGRDIFRTPGDINVEPELANWITSFSTEVQREPVPCRLQLYRALQSRRGPPEVNLTLEYEGEPSTHSRTDMRSVHEVALVPIALFNTNIVAGRSFSQSSQTSRDGTTLRLGFVNFFRGVTLHFLAPATYLEFMTLMTHQMILPDARTDHHDTKGAGVRFKSCKVVERRDWPHRNREHEFTDGIVQVWEALSPEAYESRYPHVDSTLTHEPLRRAPPVTYDTVQRLPVPPPAQISRYKMALFGLEKASRLRCCLIADVGTDSYTLESKASAHSLEFIEKSEAKFRSVVYRSQSPESYPGFPISPDVLTTQIKDLGIRTSSILLEMERDCNHHRDLRRLIVGGPGTPIKPV